MGGVEPAENVFIQMIRKCSIVRKLILIFLIMKEHTILLVSIIMYNMIRNRIN